MGSGKSFWGSNLARILNKKYVDSDIEIELFEKMSINNIFELHGENYFRNLEKEWLNKFSESNSIISLGGGFPIYNGNIDNLKTKGKVIFIKEPFEVIWKRILKDESRPIKNENGKDSLRALYEEREIIYSKADFIIESPSSTEDFLAYIK